MKIEVIEPNQTVTLKLSTNYIQRLQFILETCGWFKDEAEMSKAIKDVAQGEAKDPLSLNIETILALSVEIIEAARLAGFVSEKVIEG